MYAALAVGLDGPAYDLSALITGAEVQRARPQALFEHDAEFYNLASGEAFTTAARDLGFDGVPTPFVHPPIIALLARPLVSLPFTTTARIWCLASVVAFLAAFALLAAHAAPGRRRTLFVLAAVLFGTAALEPVLYAFWLGQTTPFIFLLVIAALAWEEKRPFLAGVCLSLAVFVKLTPVFLLIPWLRRFEKRALLGVAFGLAAATLVSIAACGLSANIEYASRIREISRITLVAFNNQSLEGTLTRALDADAQLFEWRLVTPPRAIDWLAKGATLIGAALVFFIAPPRRAGARRGARRDLAVALAIAVMLLAPTISWTHYFVFLVPAAVFIGRAAEALSAPRLLGWLPAASLVLLVRPVAVTDSRFGPGPFDFVATPFLVALVFVAVASVLSFRAITIKGQKHA
jgi:alpha-1,2-mannosyltransferase